MSGKEPDAIKPKSENKIIVRELPLHERSLWWAIQLISIQIQSENAKEKKVTELKEKLRLLNKYYNVHYSRINVSLDDRITNIDGYDFAKNNLEAIILKAKAFDLANDAYARIKATESVEMEENAIRRAAVNAERKGIEEAALTRKLEGWNEIIRTAQANLSRIPPNSPSRAPLTRKLERAQAIVASIEAAKRHLSTTLTGGSPQLIRAARETLEKAYIAANSARATINGNYNDGENTEYEVEPHENYPQLTPASNFVIPSAYPSVYSGPVPTWPSNPENRENSPIVIEEEEEEEEAEGGRRRNVKRRRTVRRARKGRRFNRTRK